MARPRKTAVKKQDALLTPQEVGEIPVEEQPYPLPKGWKWVYASDIFDILYGKGLPTKNLTETGYPVFGANGKIGYYSKYMYSEPKALMSCRGAYSGTMNLSLPFSYVTNNSLIIEGKYHKFAPKFIFLLFSSLDKKSLITGSAQPQVTIQSFNHYPVPLPPENLHGRIVDNIESLFAKLDEAKEQAEAVLDRFETRKAAILHKAFIGELTEEWRRKNDLQLSSWKYEKIASLCHSLKYGTAKKSKDKGSTVVLRMGNLQRGEIDWSNLAFTDDKEDIERYHLSQDDVLFNRTNSSELVGKTAIYRGEFPAIYAGYLIKMDYKKNILLGTYLNYIMNSHQAKEYYARVKSDGVNQSNINAKKLGAFIIPVPTLNEQQIIVSILDAIFAKEQRVMVCAEAVLEQIELMKKSILTRAFRGELSQD